MGDELEWYETAVRSFGDRVHRVGTDQWSAATPNTEWDVRALVNHVVGECAWVPPLVGGSTIADVGDALSGDLLGDDPVGAWDEQSAAALASFRAPGALDGTVQLSSGEESTREYCRQVAFDALVHSWDLARAIGDDETLDPHAVEHALEWLTPDVLNAFASGGMFATQVPVAADASPQDRLIALTGRQP
jgi:uncharacterized protein (TIGR03086 family)